MRNEGQSSSLAKKYRASHQYESMNIWGDPNQNSPNGSVTSLSSDDEEQEESLSAEPVFIQGVKIDPAKLVLTNTSEGKHFNQTVMIQNCGPKAAVIKYDGPTNNALSFTALRRGKRLSSGMRITLHIFYTYVKYNALPSYLIPIYINDERFVIKLLVRPAVAKVLAVPTHVDFGLVDIGYHVGSRTVKLQNAGSKLCRFSIDVGSPEVHITVQPIKGMIKPHSEISIKVEVSSIEEGDFNAYFIIRCGHKIRIDLTGTILMGKLEICNMPSCHDFTIMEFPKTYYDTRCTQRLVLKNNSASRTVFCILFDDYLVKKNKCFFISPMDGRLEPNEAKIFTIEYRPTRVNNDKYHFDVATIKKLNFWKDINITDYPNGLYNTLRAYKSPDMLRKNITSPNSLTPSKVFSFSNTSRRSDYSLNLSSREMIMDHPFMELEYKIRLYLYGNPEIVDVTCSPDEINLTDLILNKPVDRVLRLTNKSKSLSIKFAYEKVAYINVAPKSALLQPNSSIEVKVTINVCKLGKISTNLLMSLICNNYSTDSEDDRKEIGRIKVPFTLEANYRGRPPDQVKINTGITPTYIKEVGMNADLVAYDNMEVAIPRQTMDAVTRKQRKNHTAFIAFPNDRPKSLRPWTNNSKPVETIYAKIPRGVVSNNEVASRDQTREYYANYLKHSRMDLLKALNNDSLPVCEVTKTKQFLMYRYFTDFVRDKSLVTSNKGIIDAFIPISPLQLHKIKMKPMYIGIGLVATYSRTKSSFTITNDNDVSIRVYLIPEKQRFTFLDGEGMIVKAHSSKKVEFIFFSEYEGNHNVPIKIVVNESHIFEVTVYANVTHKRLFKSDHILRFGQQDAPHKFITLFNPLNVYIDYSWLPSDSNFVIEPAEGRIPPRKSMACMVTYEALKNKCNTADLLFQTTPHHKQRCTAAAEPPEVKTSLCDFEVDFGLVPMNMKRRRQTVLWNLSNCSVHFSIVKPVLMMDGMQITPEKGCLKSKSSKIFTIKLKSLDCVPFSYTVTIEINNKSAHEMTIKGSIIFPVLKYTPNPYKLAKFPVTSLTKFAVRIDNKTKAPIYIAFNFQKKLNCFISDCKDSERFISASFVLEASKTKTLYVCLNPKDITSMWFNMPFILNGILGPPSSTLAAGNKTRTYVPNPNYRVNPSISILRIFTIITESDFHVSKYEFEFLYHPFDLVKNVCEDKVTFTNISEKELEFCVRLETVYLPFEIRQESGNKVRHNHSSITFDLQPGDYTTLAIKFLPANAGSFYQTAAFYVRNDYQDSVHNNLHFIAKYEPVKITVPEKIYLEYIPLMFKFNKSFAIHSHNHAPHCLLKAESDNNDLQILIREEYRTDKMHKYEACLIYTSVSSGSFKPKIIFTCTCGGRAETHCIGVSENSLFTTFKVVRNVSDRIVISQTQSKQSNVTLLEDMLSHIVAKESNTFPYFPEDGDDDFGILRDTLQVVESWVFCQGFCGKFRFNIPDSFCMMLPLPREDADPKAPVEKLIYIIPYMQLLRNISSSSIAEKIGLTVSYADELELANELLCLYKRVLNFLTEMGANMPHVDAEQLLAYEQFLTYNRRIKIDSTKVSNPPTLLPEHSFYLLSKQAWLDVILQTLKIFAVGRLTIPKNVDELPKLILETTNQQEDKGAKYDPRENLYRDVSLKSIGFLNKIKQEDFMGHNILSKTEYYLLCWVTHYYKTYIAEICEQNVEAMMEKIIDDYDSCFIDSLVLATLLVAHCPYLKYGLTNLYWIPNSTAQLHHNAATIVQALCLINSSFELLPRNIYNPNNVQMILLITYLYEFLPHMYPRNVINIMTKLSTTSHIRIVIKNENKFEVDYKVLFFENEHGCFTETRSMVRVGAKSSDQLGIRFQAKFIRKVSAVLVLCGEVAGKKCAKSIAYRLVGEPDVTHVTNSFSIAAKLYSAEEHALEVQTPYKTPGCYDLYLTYTKPTSYKDLKLIDYVSVLRERIMMKFNFLASQAYFNDSGKSTILVNCVALTSKVKGGWIFLRNSEIGDFCIYLEMVTMPTKEMEFINLNVSSDIYKYKCVCDEKGSKYCKKFVTVKVPKTNVLLMETFKRMFVKLKGSDTEFWSAYLEKSAALRHMRNFYMNKDYSNDLLNILSGLTDDKYFDVNVIGLGNGFTYPNTLTVTHVEYGNLNEYVPFSIHVGDHHKLHSFQLQLHSKEVMELRQCKVVVSHYQK